MRLAIVVPYRDRGEHLAKFQDHVRAYFARDKVDRHIDYRVLIVEQDAQLPFNRGALLNIGFVLAEPMSDYVCFHDVDYLPIWADYSPPEAPTPIVWYGAELRPIAPGRSEFAAKHELESYYSGALLMPNAQFRGVDGYSNLYWGWGFEDVDLKRRFDRAGVAFKRRRGTFQALDHDNHGFKLDGRPSPISEVNKAIFEGRWAAGATPLAEGLSTLEYQIMRRQPIDDPKPERAAEWTRITVRLKGQPTAEQTAAIASGLSAAASATRAGAGGGKKPGKRR